MEKKRILWLSHLLPYPPKGGVLQRSYNLLKEAAQYHTVHLLAFAQEGLLNVHYGSVQEGIDDALKELAGICESITPVPMPLSEFRYSTELIALRSLFSKYPYTLNWLRSRTYAKGIERLLKQESFDLVYCDTVSLALYHHLFEDIPFVIGHHNIESDMMFRRASNETNPLKKAYFQIEGRKIAKYEKAFGALARLNITCSDLDTERLRQLLPNGDITSVPNGVDLTYFGAEPKALSNDGHINFIFAGRLNAYTNAKAAKQLAATIWPKLKEKFPYARCYIVGSNPPQCIVDQAEDDDSLIVTGFVDDIREYLRLADVYLCPITDGGGTKLKVLDALAMGIPLIADPIACEGIDVTGGKTVFFATQPEDYVRQAMDICADKANYSRISTDSISLVARLYSYRSIGEHFARSLEQACQPRTS